jgi:hypothetical protein
VAPEPAPAVPASEPAADPADAGVTGTAPEPSPAGAVR